MGKISKLISRLREYPPLVGWGKTLYFIACDILKHKKYTLVNVAQEDLYVRTASSDLFVAANSLVFQEYSDIRCHNPKTIIDAGANIGTSAIYFARRYPAAKIYAIEPEQENFDLLKKNTKNFPNITPIMAAIWSDTTTQKLQNRQTGQWGYTISETSGSTQDTGQEVDCITIQSLMDDYNLNTIDLLKMDIEGGEKEVLESASDWIDKVKILSVELHDRICLGCDRAFYLATQNFSFFERNGEKVTAYRDKAPVNP